MSLIVNFKRELLLKSGSPFLQRIFCVWENCEGLAGGNPKIVEVVEVVDHNRTLAPH